jgi:hypothetical protein
MPEVTTGMERRSAVARMGPAILLVVCVLTGHHAQAVGAETRCPPASPKVGLGSGRSPQDATWTISAQRLPSHGCESELLEVTITSRPNGQRPLIWGGASRLSDSGQMGRSFRVMGADSRVGILGERELVGYACGRAREIAIEYSDGSRELVATRAPNENQRKKHVWLRNLRVFAIFYGSEKRVTDVRLVDGDGRGFYRAHNYGGSVF